MLKGKELAAALKDAMTLKKVSPTELARYFGIRAPSVHDWLKDGRIGREKLDDLVRYFSDVCPPAHWGITKPSVLYPSVLFASEPDPPIYGVGNKAPPGFLEPTNLTQSQAQLRKVFTSLVSEMTDRQCEVLTLLLLDFDQANSDAKALQLAREQQLQRARKLAG